MCVLGGETGSGGGRNFIYMLIVASAGAKLTELFHGKLTNFVRQPVPPHLNGGNNLD